MRSPGRPGQADLPEIGQTLAGKYQIVRLLGEGGMAFVFEASHQRLQQRVAIKMLTPDFARDPELVARFEREARAVAGLRTRHVARVMDVDATPSGIPYIVMEFLEGRDLEAELAARTRLPVDEAVDYLLQACAGMAEAHGMGIVHRDLKPANLFLANEGDGEDRLVKVLDFGISKTIGEATKLTLAGTVMGTVLYMSPEQVRAQSTVDTRSDIWALGVILYELLAGRAPWEGHSHQIAASIVTTNPPELRSLASVPDGVAEIVRTMMQKDPQRRFASVRDVLAALAHFAPAGSIGANVADQLVNGTGSRSRASLLGALMKQTLPMASRPSLPGPPAPPPAPPPPQSSSPSATPMHALGHAGAQTPAPDGRTATVAPHSIAPLSAGGRSRARLIVIFSVVIGLIGAAGVVLIVVATLRRAQTAATTGDAAPSAAPVAEAPPTASAAAVTRAPPPTDTVEPATPAVRTDAGAPTRALPRTPGNGKKGAAAGGVRTSPTSAPAASGPPSFL